jgi:hypothetical protein
MLKPNGEGKAPGTNSKSMEPLAKLSSGKRSKLIKAPDKPVF